MLEHYGDYGVAHATIEWDAKPGPRPHTIDLQFLINEGDTQFVREVVITGLQTARPQLVNKQLELNPGSPLSPAAMADTQRKLDDLGIFSQVNMAVQNPDGNEDRKYVVYDLAEASKYSVTTGAGLEFARIGGSNAPTDLSNPGGEAGVVPRVSLDVTRIDFLGRGESLNFQGRLSTLQKRALINYVIPKPFDQSKLRLTFSLLYDDTRDITFVSKRGRSCGAARPASLQSRSRFSTDSAIKRRGGFRT